MKADTETTGQKQSGRFVKGQSGNPNGPVLETIENALRADQAKMIEGERAGPPEASQYPWRPLPTAKGSQSRPTCFNGPDARVVSIGLYNCRQNGRYDDS